MVVLEHCGLQLDRSGRLVDAYERCTSTALHHPGMIPFRPDIVHQALLALFDSDLAYHRRLRVYLHLAQPSGKVVEVSPMLRPPRTYARFKGLMMALLRDGQVVARPNPNAGPTAGGGGYLMRMLSGSIAPVIPYGAPCIGICNDPTKPIVTPARVAAEAIAHPVDDNAYQGGLKQVLGFYSISCTEEGITVRIGGKDEPTTAQEASKDGANDDGEDEKPVFPSSSPSTFVTSPSSAESMASIDYLTSTLCLSAYPMPPHVMCARLCEGFAEALGL